MHRISIDAKREERAMRRLQVGVIGLGEIGGAHCASIATLPQAQLVAVSEIYIQTRALLILTAREREQARSTLEVILLQNFFDLDGGHVVDALGFGHVRAHGL